MKDLKEMDMSDLLGEYQNQNGHHNYEMVQGVGRFEDLVSVLGYGDMTDFLADNPGCIEQMVQWIIENGNADWMRKLEEHVGEYVRRQNEDEIKGSLLLAVKAWKDRGGIRDTAFEIVHDVLNDLEIVGNSPVPDEDMVKIVLEEMKKEEPIQLDESTPCKICGVPGGH